MPYNITYERWASDKDKEIYIFRLMNSSGAFVEITNYGATIVSVVTPDQFGEFGHVVLGFDNLHAYLNNTCYIGSTIGRFANRIGKATFMLNNQQYFLEANEFENCNHSGRFGYHARIFNFDIVENTLKLTLMSHNGDGGFPGNLELKISYQWTENNQLIIGYDAVCDEDTIANFTNHAYFNLSGERDNILGHRLTLNADSMLETNNELIPTGKILKVGRRSLTAKKIAEKFGLAGIPGFNQYYILKKELNKQPGGLNHAAILDYEASGRRLNIYTSYPGLMVYSGDYLFSSYPGKKLKNYQPFDGLCLECQLYPDAPNHMSFPSAILRADERYDQKIIYEFTIMPIKDND